MPRIGDRRQLEAFVRSVELGGFSVAARELKLTPSAISKLVGRLEETLRTRLLDRTTRKLTPTREGELFLARSRRILAELEEAENEVRRASRQPAGRLRMHVGPGFATHQLVPALPRFAELYPDIQIELIVEDKTLDLIKEGIDIAVRPGPQSDVSLVAQRIFKFRRVVCASPSYLARNGEPRRPEDLAQHDCINFAGAPALAKWSFDSPAGRKVIDVSSAYSANNAECVLQCALLGLGIARLNDFIVWNHLDSGNLVPVLAESQSKETLYMLASYPQARYRLPRVAAMLEFLTASFARAPWQAEKRRL